MATFNKVFAKAILQEYTRAANNIEREVLVTACYGLENYQTLVYYTIERHL